MLYLIHPKGKEAAAMGQTDKQFGGFLRMVITSIKRIIAESDPNKKQALLEELLKDMQATLED